jgi:hypothetical protein
MLTKAEIDFGEVKHAGISRVLIAYFEERLEKHKEALVIANSIDLIKQFQGRAQELSDLLKLLKSER